MRRSKDTYDTEKRSRKGRKVEILRHNIPENKDLHLKQQLYQSIMDNTYIMVAFIDANHKIISVNAALSKNFHRPANEFVGRECFREFEKRNFICPHCPGKRAMETGQPAEAETRGVRNDGSRFNVHIQAFPTFGPDGKVTGFIEIVEDITERKQKEEMLRKAQKEQETILTTMSELVVYQDSKHKIIWANKAAGESVGLSAEELLGRYCYETWHGQSKPCEGCPVEKAQETGRPETGEIYSPDGRVWSIRANPVKDAAGNVIGFVEVTLDITERKKTEHEIIENRGQLKSLASQLTLAEEQERHRIAMELHDQISQYLAISKIKLQELLASNIDENSRKTLEQVCSWLTQTIDRTRSLTFDLSYPMLYDLGFEKAVESWLVDEIEKKHNLTTEYRNDNEPKPLDDEVRMLLFRDVRELLVNIVKHANATKVKVTINKIGNRIRVTVEDDGMGFDPVQAMKTTISKAKFGLFRIQERLEYFKGHFEIKSAPGCGCKVTIEAPLKQDIQN